MLVFEERGKPEYSEKNHSEQGENQQQTQPTYDAGTEYRTRATLVGGECSHHYTTPAPRFSCKFGAPGDQSRLRLLGSICRPKPEAQRF